MTQTQTHTAEAGDETTLREDRSEMERWLEERRDHWLNEAQRLAMLVRTYGGNPEPEKVHPDCQDPNCRSFGGCQKPTFCDGLKVEASAIAADAWSGFSGCGVRQVRGRREDIDLVKQWCEQASTIPHLQKRVRSAEAIVARAASVSDDPQWPEVLRMLRHTSQKEAGEQPSKLFADEAKLIVAALAASPAPRAPAAVPEELRRLSEAATSGEWRMRSDAKCIFAKSTNPHIGGDDVVVSTAYSDRSLEDDEANLTFIAALVNAFRAGTLAAAPAAPPADGGTEGQSAKARAMIVAAGGGSGIYIASKTSHAARWRAMRASGTPIISTWIDEAGKGETACFADLWSRCVDEAATAGALVIYMEPGEVLKGAFVEAGAALSCGVPVYAVGCDEFSFTNHLGVTRCASLEDAFAAALSSRTPAGAAGDLVGDGAIAFADAVDPNQPWNRRKTHDQAAISGDGFGQGSRGVDGLEASAGSDQPQERGGRGADGALCQPIGDGEGPGSKHSESGLCGYQGGSLSDLKSATRPAFPAPAASAGRFSPEYTLTKRGRQIILWFDDEEAVSRMQGALERNPAAALAPAAQVNPGREEIARIILAKWEALLGPANDHGTIGGIPGAWRRSELCDQFADAILAARPVAEGDAAPDRIRHVKRGTEYEVLVRGAQIQTDKLLNDYAKVDVYRGADGATWVRPVDEMNDGRFVPVARPAPSPAKGGTV